MSKGLSRRDFMKASLIGGAALGAGLGHGHFHLTYGQSANVRFSTWHVPVGYEVKTVWEPMLEDLKKKTGGKITSTMYAGAALGARARNTMTSFPKACRTWATSQRPGRPEDSP